MSAGKDQLTHADRELRARLRFILIALMVCFTIGWIAWFYPYDDLFDRSGTQLGGDFPVFYVQARFAAEGRWKDLYDFDAQRAEMQRFLPGLPPEKFLPALYPPWTAVLLRPLAYFSYPVAYAIFFAVSLGLIALTVWLWTKVFPLAQGPWKSVVWLSAFGFPTILETLISGQASALAVAIFGVGAALLTMGRPFSAGVVLGLAAYKPTVLLLVVLGVALLSRKTSVGCIVGVGMLWGLSYLVVGPGAEQKYFDALRGPQAQQAINNPPVHKFHGLAASTPFTRSNLARNLMFLAAALAVSRLAARATRIPPRPGGLSLFLATLGVLQLLGSPYLPIYDLALLFPITFLFLNGLSERYEPSIGRHAVFAHVALGLLFFGAYISQGIAQQTGWQPFAWLFVPAFAWCLTELFRSPAATPKVTPG